MNMYMCMKINYINSPFINFKAMLLSLFTTSSAMPGCHAEQLEFPSAIEIIDCQNPGTMHESMLSDVHIGEKVPPAY